jgi:arsenate reductase-like glutaredoxin family protein
MKQYTTRSMANNTVKINCTIPDTYRKLVKFMSENNIIFHTYQPKKERAYRVVIKYLHHSIDTKEVAEELSSHGHKVRNIISAKQRQTKEPLNLFFVDVESADNNKDVYNIRKVLNSTAQIEPPRRDKNIIQCMRCQQYGHKKTYCNRLFMCVK